MRIQCLVMLLAAIVLVILGGCHATRLAPPVSFASLHEADMGENRPASLILLADAQINENHGRPTFWQSKFAQLKLQQAVARRSVQQTVFSDVLLAETVKHAKAIDHAPVIFLGDAMNMSCRSEYDRFTAAMNSAGTDWIALPGNHDGFYSGVTQPRTAETHKGKIPFFFDPRYGRDRSAWEWVCLPSSLLPKSVASGASASEPSLPLGVVELYTQSVLARFPGSQIGATTLPAGCDEKTWSNGVLRNIAWCSTNGELGSRPPWRAFVVQRLTIGSPDKPVSVILLDSSVYGKEPCFIWCSDVGVVGGLGAEQRGIVQTWLEDDFASGRPTLIMAHHPISDWNDDRTDKTWLEKYVSDGKVSLVVSAHTHDGCVRDPFKGNLAGFRELNISSIIDFPASYTRLWLNSSDKGIAASYTFVPLKDLFPDSSTNGKCAPFVSPDTIDAQTSHALIGSYANQLSQIGAEIAQAQLVMSQVAFQKTPSAKDMTAELMKQLDAVKTAEALAHEKCSFPFWRSLECEHERKISDVAWAAQEELTKVETSDEWKAYIATTVGSALGACIAAQSSAPYWEKITSHNSLLHTPSCEKPPCRDLPQQCLVGDPYARKH